MLCGDTEQNSESGIIVKNTHAKHSLRRQRKKAALTFCGEASVGEAHHCKATGLQHSVHLFEDFLHTSQAISSSSNTKVQYLVSKY